MIAHRPVFFWKKEDKSTCSLIRYSRVVLWSHGPAKCFIIINEQVSGTTSIWCLKNWRYISYYYLVSFSDAYWQKKSLQEVPIDVVYFLAKMGTVSITELSCSQRKGLKIKRVCVANPKNFISFNYWRHHYITVLKRLTITY